jgi:hypothetical protein
VSFLDPTPGAANTVRTFGFSDPYILVFLGRSQPRR